MLIFSSYFVDAVHHGNFSILISLVFSLGSDYSGGKI